MDRKINLSFSDSKKEELKTYSESSPLSPPKIFDWDNIKSKRVLSPQPGRERSHKIPFPSSPFHKHKGHENKNESCETKEPKELKEEPKETKLEASSKEREKEGLNIGLNITGGAEKVVGAVGNLGKTDKKQKIGKKEKNESVGKAVVGSAGKAVGSAGKAVGNAGKAVAGGGKAVGGVGGKAVGNAGKAVVGGAGKAVAGGGKAVTGAGGKAVVGGGKVVVGGGKVITSAGGKAVDGVQVDAKKVGKVVEEKVLSPGLLGPKLQNGVKLSNTSDSMSSNVPRRKEGAENRKDVLTVLSKGKKDDGKSKKSGFDLWGSSWTGFFFRCLILFSGVGLWAFSGFSFFLIIAFIALPLVSHQLQVDSYQRFVDEYYICKALNSASTFKAIDACPPFCDPSQIEKADWISQFILILWPNMKEAAEESIRQSMEPLLESSKPDYIKSLSLSVCDLGGIPPVVERVTTVSLFPVCVDILIRYSSETEIGIKAVTKSVNLRTEITDLYMSGVLRLTLSPLSPSIPCVKAISLSFLSQPTIRFNIGAAGVSLMSVPGFEDWIRSFLDSTLRDLLVWPKKMIVPFSDLSDYEFRVSNELPPHGILWVRFVGIECFSPHHAIDVASTLTVRGTTIDFPITRIGEEVGLSAQFLIFDGTLEKVQFQLQHPSKDSKVLATASYGLRRLTDQPSKFHSVRLNLGKRGVGVFQMCYNPVSVLGKRQVKKIFKNAAKALEQKKPSQDEREKAPLPPTKSKPTKISLKESIGFLGSIDLPNPSLPNPAFPGFSSVMPREFQFSAKKGETTFSTYLLSIYLLRVTGMNLNQIQMKVNCSNAIAPTAATQNTRFVTSAPHLTDDGRVSSTHSIDEEFFFCRAPGTMGVLKLTVVDLSTGSEEYSVETPLYHFWSYFGSEEPAKLELQGERPGVTVTLWIRLFGADTIPAVPSTIPSKQLSGTSLLGPSSEQSPGKVEVKPTPSPSPEVDLSAPSVPASEQKLEMKKFSSKFNQQRKKLRQLRKITGSKYKLVLEIIIAVAVIYGACYFNFGIVFPMGLIVFCSLFIASRFFYRQKARNEFFLTVPLCETIIGNKVLPNPVLEETIITNFSTSLEREWNSKSRMKSQNEVSEREGKEEETSEEEEASGAGQEILEDVLKNQEGSVLMKGLVEPEWVARPDMEKSEWVNRLLIGMWPHLRLALEETLLDLLSSLFESLEIPNTTIVMDSLEFGLEPPILSGICGHLGQRVGKMILLDLCVCLPPFARAALTVVHRGISIPILLHSISLRGVIRIRLWDLVSTWPCFSSLGISIISIRDFNFCGSVAGIAVTNFFLIRQFFLSYLHSTLFKLLFFPRELVIPLFNYSGLAWGRGGSPCSPDACLLRVSVLRATNLRNLEILTKSDPYVTVSLLGTNQAKSTSCKTGTLNPEWNEDFEFYSPRSAGVLEFKIIDQDTVRLRKGSIGEVKYSWGPKMLKPNKIYHFTRSVKSSKKDDIGSLLFEIQPLPLLPYDATTFSDIAHKGSEVVFFLYIGHCQGLNVSGRSLTTTSISVIVDEQFRRTPVMKGCNPVFKESFFFVCKLSDVDNIRVVAWEGSTEMGSFTIDSYEVIKAGESPVQHKFDNCGGVVEICTGIRMILVQPLSDEEMAAHQQRRTKHLTETKKKQGLKRKTKLRTGEILAITVVKGIDIPGIQSDGLSDPYVVISSPNSKKKTKVIKNNLNPIWDEQLFFSKENPSNPVELEIIVMDWNRIQGDKFIGKVSYEVPSLSLSQDLQEVTLPIDPSGEIILKFEWR